MPPSIHEEIERLETVFQAAGAKLVKADILQPADTLLDLYGEDIRGRAFVTHDALRGEFMLRPDFTVPVVQMHMQGGAEPARYTYSGKVFRQQDIDASLGNEHYQVGYEVFDRVNPSAADAEVFALIAGALGSLPVRAVTGDMGILKAAVSGLNTFDRRKAALLRHIWRPNRFRALLDRYGGVTPVHESRRAMLSAADPMADVDRCDGLRQTSEIYARIEALRQDASEPPISKGERDLLAAILDLAGPSTEVLTKLQSLCTDMPDLNGSALAMARRLDALDQRGIDVSTLEFQANFGRSTMEYYDGFVFGFHLQGQTDLPPVATGGRYDALTRVLGRGKSIPAVGGVIRPALILAGGGS